MPGYIPEWQLQEVLAANPRQLEIHSRFEGLRLIDQQRYLPTTGGYIDLLLKTKTPGGLLIVEIKADPLLDTKAAAQALDYKHGVATDLRIDPSAIHCMVAAPAVLEGLERTYEEMGVAVRVLDYRTLLGVRPDARSRLPGKEDGRFDLLSRRRRGILDLVGSRRPVSQGSVRRWIGGGIHDQNALKQVAAVIRYLSDQASLFSHEVRLSSSSLDTFDRQWFWFFYSAMDRRGNAALFIKAKERLVSRNLFSPRDIKRFVVEQGEEHALKQLTEELSGAGLPLVVDLKFGRRSLAKSIIDAALVTSDFECNFATMLEALRGQCDGGDLGKFVVRWIQQSVYGMGPRSAAQFVRGMVLKGPWRLELDDTVFLENTKYNALFAGPARLSIANEDYVREAGEFADEYLDGNRGILSHALWYIRKRYCDKVPLCPECPVAGYCSYFRSHGTSRRTRGVQSKRFPYSFQGSQARLPLVDKKSEVAHGSQR